MFFFATITDTELYCNVTFMGVGHMPRFSSIKYCFLVISAETQILPSGTGRVTYVRVIHFNRCLILPLGWLIHVGHTLLLLWRELWRGFFCPLRENHRSWRHVGWLGLDQSTCVGTINIYVLKLMITLNRCRKSEVNVEWRVLMS